MATKFDIVIQAREWLGLNETDGSFKYLIDLYNSDYPIPRGYKAKYTSEWCAIFVTDVAIKCHATDLIGKECSVPKFMAMFKKNGIWVGKTNTPDIGDIVIFDWDGNKDGDHIGIVEEIIGNTVISIEGNFSEAVRRRSFNKNWNCIVGYARPKYDTKNPIYRLYNPNNGEHFYTASYKELSDLQNIGWSYEGLLGYAKVFSEIPVYRLYNPNVGEHFYTTDLKERESLMIAGWIYEGVAFYASETSNVPIYRLYNKNARTGTHHFTWNLDEANALTKTGWISEGIGWYME